MKRRKLKPRRRKVTIDYQESVNIVPSTRRSARRMRRNMHEAARCNVNLQLQKRARQLLTATEVESKPAAPAAAQKPATVTAQANAVVQTNKVVRAPARQVLQLAVAGFKNGIKAVRSFAKRKIPFWRGSQWQASRKEA